MIEPALEIFFCAATIWEYHTTCTVCTYSIEVDICIMMIQDKTYNLIAVYAT